MFKKIFHFADVATELGKDPLLRQVVRQKFKGIRTSLCPTDREAFEQYR